MAQTDFGFAPGDRGKKGKETQADRLRAMFSLRHPATTLIDRQKLNKKSIGTLNQLIAYYYGFLQLSFWPTRAHQLPSIFATNCLVALPSFATENGFRPSKPIA